tara:strand:- start:109 stop:435 length:327 start_codon:yes stop_codon:yes gene_type:complete
MFEDDEPYDVALLSSLACLGSIQLFLGARHLNGWSVLMTVMVAISIGRLFELWKHWDTRPITSEQRQKVFEARSNQWLVGRAWLEALEMHVAARVAEGGRLVSAWLRV